MRKQFHGETKWLIHSLIRRVAGSYLVIKTNKQTNKIYIYIYVYIYVYVCISRTKEPILFSLLLFHFLSPSNNSFFSHQTFGQFLMTFIHTDKIWIKGRKTSWCFIYFSHQPSLCWPALLKRMFWSLQRQEKLQFSSNSLLSKWRRKRSQHLISV